MLNTKIIGQKIADARKKIKISQAQLAERLFISSQAVGKWERGESMPDIITFTRLAEILGVDLNYFSASENVNSPSTEMASVNSGMNQSAELLPNNQDKKLNWDMSRGNWVDADFSGLKNLHEKFSSSNMQRCMFIGSSLSGLLLKSNHADGCDFSKSDIKSSHIQNSNLTQNLFKQCSLNDTEFSGSHINGCDFSGADFTGVTVKSSSFSKNKLTNAVWNHTSFIGTQLSDLVFESTLDGCYFENCSFTRVTFQHSTLLDTFFKNRSMKRIQFIDCQADRMTYEFLKNGKADLTGVKQITA